MFTLYQFELQKIMGRKMVWITGGVLLAGLLLWGMAGALLPQSREYSDGSLNGYEANRAERNASGQISGRAVDQQLLDEMRTNYEDFIYNGNYKKALPYLDIYNFAGNALGTAASTEILACDSDMLYTRLHSQLKANTPPELKGLFPLDEPVIYRGYFDGWRQMADLMKLPVCMEIMFAAICLSTVFTVEHTRKTDQMILCSRLGKKKLYTAKLLAGLTVGTGFALLLSLVLFGIIAFLYGFDGYDTALQFVLLRPFDLTIGQAVLILTALSIAGTALISIFTMVLSEVTQNSIASTGIITGILLVTLFIMEMPVNLRLLSEIWYMLPSNLVSLNGAFRYSLFHAGSTPLAAYQYAPLVYLAAGILFSLIGKVTYNRYQISGR